MVNSVVIGNCIAVGAGSSPSDSPAAPGYRFTVNTATTDRSSSNADQFKLPTVSAGSYNAVVLWGDGQSDTITSYNQSEVTHTYASSGTYTVDIKGSFVGHSYVGGDAIKVVDLQNWGGTNLTINNTAAFQGCTNMSISATDTCTLTGDLSSCFRSTDITGGLSGWDFTNVTSFASALTGNSNWNEDISSWSIGNCGSFGFSSTAMSTANYDALLIAWEAQSVQVAVNFDTSAQYTSGGAAEAARTSLTGKPNSWRIIDGGPA
tara:strand:+ start:217 stop:1005 length:789 start_codon:yes stop_codon:yes gene_type:complete